MKGKLIVIEGHDGVGKQTQTALLKERLAASELVGENKVLTWNFPVYTSPWGQLVRQYLDGDSPFQFNPGYASLILAADRSLVAPEIKAALDRGDWIVCDRYVSSSAVFQGISYPDLTEREKFITWLEWLEHEHFGLPHPDLTILLALPTEISHARAAARREEAKQENSELKDKVGKHDIHEENIEFMDMAAAEYRRLAGVRNWDVIECGDPKTMVQFSREDIHSKVWQAVQGLQA